jgi:hypothetical protein
MSIAGDTFDHHDQQSVVGANPRIVVTQEGTLDPSLLIRTEGYMHKKGGAVNARGGFRNWKKRYFILSPVDFFGYQGYELQYYDAPNGTLKGTVALNDVDLYVDSKSTNKKVKFEFQLLLQNGGELQLSCDSEEEREEWVKTLQVIIDFLHKVATQPAMMLDGYDPMMEDDVETFHIGEELAQNCQAFGPGLFGSEAGKSVQFVVNVHDLTGQRVSKGGMPIVATITNSDSLYYLAVIDNEDGTYYCNYVLGQAGKYQLSITINEEHHIFGSPFDLEILPSKTIPKFCIAEGDILQQMPTKSTGTFTIQAMDGFGNRKARGGDPFEVVIMGPGQVVDLEDRNDGSYGCTITTTNVQQQAQNIFSSSAIMIMVTLYGKAIEGSPFKPVIVDGMRTQSFLALATNANGNANTPVSVKHLASAHMGEQQTVSTPGKSAASVSVRSPSMKSQSGANAPAPVSPRVGSTHLLSSTPSMSTPQQAPSVASSTRNPPPPPSVTNSNTYNQNVRTNNGTADVHTPSSIPATSQQQQQPPQLQQQQQQQQQQVLPQSPNLQGLSRLERSRQRALLAKSMTEQSGSAPAATSGHHTTSASGVSPRNPLFSPSSALLSSTGQSESATSPVPSASAMDNSSQRPGLASSAVASGRLAQLAARSKMTLETLKNTNAPPTGNVAGPHVTGSSSGSSSSSSGGGPSHHQEIMRSLMTGLRSETAPEQVALTTMEQRIWQQVHLALTHPAQYRAVLDRIQAHLETLQQVFVLFADRIPGEDTQSSSLNSLMLRLATAQGYGGLLKLLEMYEVIPHFVNRLEAKTIFNLAMAAQKSVRSTAGATVPPNGLDFPSFVKFLLLVANCALNKAQAFADQYATPESRVDFILIKLGLGDPVRFLSVRRALLNANADEI